MYSESCQGMTNGGKTEDSGEDSLQSRHAGYSYSGN